MNQRFMAQGGAGHPAYAPRYASAVRVGCEGLLEISGLAAYDEHGQEIFPDSLLDQTRYVLGLMRTTLGAVGAGFEDVARLCVFTTDIHQWPSVWAQIAPELSPLPAVSVIEISRLSGPVGMVELEITASVPAREAGTPESKENRMSPTRQPDADGAIAIVPESLADRDWELHAPAFLLRSGDLIFLSGVGPVDGNGEVVGRGDAGAQTRQIFSVMKDILEQAGGSLDDIVRLRLFVTDMEHRARINPERFQAFKKPRAVSTFVQVSGLEDDDWLVMMEATAFVPKLND
jgi:2-iminobutanoate/2-iminopropanoate deaminase